MGKEIKGVIERFLSAVSANPDLTAIEIDGTDFRLSYAELLGRMERYRAQFKTHDIGPGDFTVLLLPPQHELISSLYALVSLGTVATPINPHLTDYEMKRIMDDVQPAALVITEKVYIRYRDILAGIGTVRKIFFTDSIPSDGRCRAERVLLSDYSGKGSSLDPPGGDPIVTCHYTYRGEGVPLGVPHRYSDYSACQEGLEGRYMLPPGSAGMLGLPVYPIYGTLMIFLLLSMGCRLTVVEGLMKQNFAELFARLNVRFTCLVPILFPKLLFEARAIGPRESLHFDPDLITISSATYLWPELIAEIAEATGIEISQGYGLTEALAVASSCSGGPAERGTFGTMIPPDTTIRIVDFRGEEVRPGQIGEIVIQGPTVSGGFLRQERANARFFRRGCFYSGDLGFIDQGGFVRFAGRSPSIAKVAAQMVDLEEVKQVLLSHPEVGDASLVVKGTNDSDSFVSAAVLCAGRSSVTEHDLQSYCSSFLSKYKVPAEIHILQGIGKGTIK